MTDYQRLEQIDRWAHYVRDSKGAWKKDHSAFLNAQIQKANAFYERLAKTPGGKEKIIRIFGIKNLDAAPFLK
ncbi:hypothetical protein HYV43_05460 [Candidatus Micrarchaeota archaeon]|nr:hypothetical protein [Candidatus Micrarchaeota archaeon]